MPLRAAGVKSLAQMAAGLTVLADFGLLICSAWKHADHFRGSVMACAAKNAMAIIDANMTTP